MYSIYADDICIYNDKYSLEDMKLLNPKLTLEDNAAGTLTMTVPSTNRGYEYIQRMMSDIFVLKDGIEIWRGRVLSENEDFYKNRELTCEGELAFLNDTIQPPKTYSGISISDYISSLLSVHNEKALGDKQFIIGTVTVSDDNFPDHSTNYEKTIKLLNDLVDEYGGHLQIRKENSARYLDYLSDYPNSCTQTIRFGENLIDYTKGWDMSEFATVIVPLGNRQSSNSTDGQDSYLTVESVNDGSIYVKSDDAVAAYGWIEKTVTWDDVTDASVLLEKANTYLSDLQFDSMELTVNAVDLHYLNPDIEAVELLDQIQVISRPHGLDRVFPVTKLEIPLDSPENTQFKMGVTVKTSLTYVNNKNSASVSSKLNKMDGGSIKSGTISANNVDFSCEYGGFCKGEGLDADNTSAYGAMVYGANGKGNAPYILVASAGSRMQGENASLSVGEDITMSKSPSISSDLRVKNTIDYDLGGYEKLFHDLKAATFKYNGETSNETHFGFIAQDVETAILNAGLSPDNLAFLVKSPVPSDIGDYRYSLKYEEVIALITHMVQKLYDEVQELLQKKEAMNG